MTEWLTENVGRAYPLTRYPAEMGARKWALAVVDACVGTVGWDALPQLVSVRRDGSSAVFRVGTPAYGFAEVRATPGKSRFVSAFGGSQTVKALLSLDCATLSEAIASAEDGSVVAIGVPFDLRCTSASEPAVTAVAGDSPELCTTPCTGRPPGERWFPRPGTLRWRRRTGSTWRS